MNRYIYLILFVSLITRSLSQRVCADAKCGEGQSVIAVCLSFDMFPGDNAWVITDESGESLAKSGPLRTHSPLSSTGHAGCVDGGQMITFTILDSAGNGMCCKFGLGSYSVWLDYKIVASGGEFSSRNVHKIDVEDKLCPTPRTMSVTIGSSPGKLSWRMGGQLFVGNETEVAEFSLCQEFSSWILEILDDEQEWGGDLVAASSISIELDDLVQFSDTDLRAGYKALAVLSDTGLSVSTCPAIAFSFDNQNDPTTWILDYTSLDSSNTKRIIGASSSNTLNQVLYFCDQDFKISLTVQSSSDTTFDISWKDAVFYSQTDPYTTITKQATITKGVLQVEADCSSFSITVFPDQYYYETSWTLFDIQNLWRDYVARSSSSSDKHQPTCDDPRSFDTLTIFRESCANQKWDCDDSETLPSTLMYYYYCYTFNCRDDKTFPSSDIFMEVCSTHSDCSVAEAFSSEEVYEVFCDPQRGPINCSEPDSFDNYYKYLDECDTYTYLCTDSSTWPTQTLYRQRCEETQYSFECTSGSTSAVDNFPTYESYLTKCYFKQGVTCADKSMFLTEKAYNFYCRGFSYNCSLSSSYPSYEIYVEECSDSANAALVYKDFHEYAIRTVEKNPLAYSVQDSRQNGELNFSDSVLCAGLYLFVVLDDYEDGMCCDFGDGRIILGYQDSELVVSGEFQKANHLLFEAYEGTISTRQKTVEDSTENDDDSLDRSWVVVPVVGFSVVGGLFTVLAVQYGKKKGAMKRMKTTEMIQEPEITTHPRRPPLDPPGPPLPPGMP